MRKLSQSKHIAAAPAIPSTPAKELSCQKQVTPPSVQEAPVMTNGTDRVSKLMAKKAERKAKKLAESTADEPVQATVAPPEVKVEPSEESIPVRCQISDDDTSPSGNDAESTHSLTTQEPADAPSVTSDSDASPAVAAADSSSPTFQQSEQQQAGADANSEAVDEPTIGVAACLNFDDIMSDSDSEAEAEAENTMLDCTLFTQAANQPPVAPVMWCSAPDGPIDGWMAVAVPTECAPEGAFDGLWTNQAEERILIDKLEIMFESGVTWCMEMHSAASLSVVVDGSQIYAELDSSGANLIWSDGDIWTFCGKATESASNDENQAITAEAAAGMMMTFLPDSATYAVDSFPDQQMYPMYQELDMPPPSTWVPREKKIDEWEICWDLKKKGWCPRGANCEWYHPEESAAFF